MDEPLVSVIIPTYNSGKTLDRCLSSIKNQTYKNIEVIVVDNFSKDNTPEICKKHGAKLIQVEGERARAKNIGVKHAKGKYVLFIDSDMELTPRVVEECVRVAESNPKVGGVIIPERSVGKSFWVKVRDFERQFYAGSDIESARFFPKELVERVGGFDEDVVFYEEATLPNKIRLLGYDVKARINAPIHHIEEDFSLWRWLKKKYYYGKTLRKFQKNYKHMDRSKTSVMYRLKLFLGNRGFYSKPHLAIGVLILKGLEFISAKLGYLTERVKNG